MNVLDLFSGIGGFSLGLERAGMRTVAFCEIEPYCRAVLKKHWPNVPCYDDVRTIRGASVGPIDVICGGFPCQPFSLAGKRRGAEDDRHLWPEMRRLVAECRPSWVIGENVPGLVSMGLDEVLSDLDAIEYTTRTFVLPACAVDAPHRRERLWIVANSRRLRGRPDAAGYGLSAESAQLQQAHGQARPDNDAAVCRNVADPEGQQDGRLCVRGLQPDPSGSRVSPGVVAHAERRGSQGRDESIAHQAAEFVASRSEQDGRRQAASGTWRSEPDVGRVAHGVPSRVDRLRALGNAVVPQIPEIIGRAIMQAEAMTTIGAE